MARPYIITIASEKGGVGKTTLATNLAIYLKGLAEDLPLTLLSFDNHFTIDRMFKMTRPAANSDVSQLFAERLPEDLANLGQYGVNYISSHRNLHDAFELKVSSLQLATTMSRSKLGGILIIDTSPTLDVFTRNALYAADRVIVPIKDAPSLENCQHLADFLSANKLQKTTLKILPCLIDTRIRFDGPFKNSYQLLKAYAINRGYRCYEGYIAKSPKVESLATNPSGKIYPVMTHGRGTEVHIQFSHLARQVYLEYLEQGPKRLSEISNSQFEEQERHHRALSGRMQKLAPFCPWCKKPLPKGGIWPHAWYFENLAGTVTGFFEDDCFVELLIRECYPELKREEQLPLVKELLLGANPQPYLLIALNREDPAKKRLRLHRLSESGQILSERTVTPREPGLLRRLGHTSLMDLFEEGERNEEKPPVDLILAHRCGQQANEILAHEGYQRWQKLFAQACENLRNRPRRNAPKPEAQKEADL